MSEPMTDERFDALRKENAMRRSKGWSYSRDEMLDEIERLRTRVRWTESYMSDGQLRGMEIYMVEAGDMPRPAHWDEEDEEDEDDRGVNNAK